MELKGKKILVTGADGFIGSHLVEKLVHEGCKVSALSYYNSFNYWGWLEDLDCINEIEVISGDIRDPHFCVDITRGIDVIFHLAALIAIPFSYKSPDIYVETNIKGTLNICKAALTNTCKRIVHTSTSEVYGTAKYVPIDENHPLQPQSPYSASKIGADAMAMSYFNSFDLPLLIARPFNTYGPRQSARAIIPTIITQLASGKNQIELGDTRPTRDFSYVMDTCTGLLELAKCDEAIGTTVNIGSNSEISIGELFNSIQKEMGTNAEVVTDNQRIRPDKSEVLRLWCDNSRIQGLTGYSPKYSIEKGIEATIRWFSNKENLKRYKSDLYNI